MINSKMQKLGASRSVIRELFEYGKMRKAQIGADNVFDFSLGNPSTPPPHKVNHTLLELISNENPTALHGYTSADGDVNTRRAIAAYIRENYDEKIDEGCIYMTVGAAGALTSVITALVTEGEEVICLAPYFPEYKVFIERCGGVVRSVPTKERDFSLDIDKIANSINEKTAAIIINSPNNPTGAIYTEDEISRLADLLRLKEKEYGKNIYPLFWICL